MKLLAPTAQQSVIGGSLNQGMLEGAAHRAVPAPEDQLSAGELLECLVQLLLRPSCDGADQLERERTAERCSDLGELARRSKTIQTREGRCMQRCRDRQRCYRPATA